jgi:hypothetical protein
MPHAFLTSALDGGEWLDSRPGRFIPRESAPGNHWIGSGGGSRTGPDTEVAMRKNPCPCRESNLGRSGRSLVTILTELSQLVTFE